MSRRSTRLKTSGYYQDDDDASSSSGGSVAGSVVSYKESSVRIFKKKPNAKRSGPTPRSTPVPRMKRSVSNSSVNSQCSLGSHISSASMLNTSLAQQMNNDSYWQEPEPEPEAEPTGFVHPAPASPIAKLWNLIFELSPGKALSLVYWWLGTAWYQLTTAASLFDVYTLSRCVPSVKKWLLLGLLVLLGLLGAWLFVSFRVARPRAEMTGKMEREASKWSVWPEKLGAPALDLSLQSRVQKMEQQLTQLASDFHARSQQDSEPSEQIPPAAERENAPVVPQLTREEVIKLLEEFVHQQKQVVQDEQSNDSILRIQNDIATIRQQQDMRMEQLLQKVNSQTEEMFREIKEASSAFVSNANDEQQTLLSALSQLKEQVGQTQLELMDVRTAQRNMASNMETLSSKLESVKDMVEAEVIQLVHRMLFGSSHDSTPISSEQALISQLVLRKDLETLRHDLEKKVLADLSQKQIQTAELNSVNVKAILAGGAITKEVENIVQRALKLYSADQIGLVDYALESAGASVLSTRCSETFETKTALLSLFGIPLWYFSQSPRAVIQPDVYPGNCWAFKGSQGNVVIQLAARITPTSFTLEHIPKSVALRGSISSAPRDFSVYGLDEIREEGLLLGHYTYDQDGDSIQTFQAQNKELGTFRVIELKVNNNWGHPEYTCLYRFRVHGEPVK
ncbi:SUN domain-containing protein 2 isoform X2 [Hemiscyllium ocellatum]|uniref:SUN domain-containing protein 2 isoform X2 n=1 Tax=Hemiscyllium ocellatum TaxID=170820 RepID=UPI00296772AE|nr:SUN domain-containing protein 2 isoform X2 [Hemiscyllium ocellatum]